MLIAKNAQNELDGFFKTQNPILGSIYNKFNSCNLAIPESQHAKAQQKRTDIQEC